MSNIISAKSHIKIRNFDGYNAPNSTVTLDRFREAVNYTPTVDDIFVNTYPKSGTTWMIYIVWGILNDGAAPPQWQEMTQKYAPEFEVLGTANLPNIVKPRILKTHLQSPFLPLSDAAKYIYVARNPWDTCVSYYNYAIQRPDHWGLQEDSSFLNFVTAFAHGELPYGYYFSHIVENYRRRHDSNMFFITYEELKTDLEKCVLDIAAFLGPDLKKRLLENNEKILKNIVRHCDFSYMRGLSFEEKQDENMRKIKFFQNGCSGYAKSKYENQELQLIEDKVAEYFDKVEFKDLLTVWEKFL